MSFLTRHGVFQPGIIQHRRRFGSCPGTLVHPISYVVIVVSCRETIRITAICCGHNYPETDQFRPRRAPRLVHMLRDDGPPACRRGREICCDQRHAGPAGDGTYAKRKCKCGGCAMIVREGDRRGLVLDKWASWHFRSPVLRNRGLNVN